MAHDLDGIKAPPRNTSELADRVYWYQLHVFQICFLLFCIVPCVVLVLYLFPELLSFMGSGPQRSTMVVLKLLILVPMVLLFAGLEYAATLLAAILNVFLIRLFVPALRMPEALDILLQFYSDPRWLYQSRGFKNFPWWVSLWGGIGETAALDPPLPAIDGVGNRYRLWRCRAVTPYYVYMLECRGGRLYTGITTDIERRFAEHRAGRKGARFTRAHPPAKLLAATGAANRSEALKLEAALKRLRRAGKLAWARQHAISR